MSVEAEIEVVVKVVLRPLSPQGRIRCSETVRHGPLSLKVEYVYPEQRKRVYNSR